MAKNRLTLIALLTIFILSIVSCTDSDLRQLCALAGIDADRFFVGDNNGGVHYTVDGGQSFDRQETGTSDGIMGIGLAGSYKAYWGNNGAFGTGSTMESDFQAMDTGTTEDLNDGSVVDDLTRVVGNNGTLLTYDGSTVNLTQISNNDLYGIDCPTFDTCYVSGSNGSIYKTTNGGADWNPQNSGTTNALFDVFALRSNPNIVWAAGENGTLSWSDNGETWNVRPVSESEGRALGDFNAIGFKNENVGFLAGENYFTTADGGATLNPIAAIARDLKRGILFEFGGLLIGPRNEAYRLDDDLNPTPFTLNLNNSIASDDPGSSETQDETGNDDSENIEESESESSSGSEQDSSQSNLKFEGSTTASGNQVIFAVDTTTGAVSPVDNLSQGESGIAIVDFGTNLPSGVAAGSLDALSTGACQRTSPPGNNPENPNLPSFFFAPGTSQTFIYVCGSFTFTVVGVTDRVDGKVRFTGTITCE